LNLAGSAVVQGSEQAGVFENYPENPQHLVIEMPAQFQQKSALTSLLKYIEQN
jgi:hypothetical protein